jgi:hypothetical protein
MTPETENVPYGRKTQRPSPVKDVYILWITAGLSCDTYADDYTNADPKTHAG